MTVSAVSYFSNLHQSTRTPGKEKQEQKGVAAGVGKT